MPLTNAMQIAACNLGAASFFLVDLRRRYPHSEAYGNRSTVGRWYSSRGNENRQRSDHVRRSDTSLANRPSGVLFVGRRRAQRLELDT